MARLFRFSLSSPKKQTPTRAQPPTVLERPMSKAHKILGSTPLSIDAAPPPSWDDSSVMGEDDRLETTAPSCDNPDSADDAIEHETDSFPFDNHDAVGIAESDNGWAHDSDVLPRHPLKLNGAGADLDKGPEAAGRTLAGAFSMLSKSRSSSTIKSWYDKSKLPLSISQQTSSSAMAKGPPTSMLDVDDMQQKTQTQRKRKSKPARLDLSSLVPGSMSYRKGPRAEKQQDIRGGGHGELVLGPEYMMKSPSVLSPSSTAQMCRTTRESSRSPAIAVETALPGTSTSRRPPDKTLSRLPSLYDHYEQMSIRRVMRQHSRSGLSQADSGLEAVSQNPAPSSATQSLEQAGRRRDWLHESAPPTPQTALYTMPLLDKSSPATYTSSVSSRHTRTSKASKTTDRSFGSADLQQTSLLVLSSDSEEEQDGIDDNAVSFLINDTKNQPASTLVGRPSDFLDDEEAPFATSRPTTIKEPMSLAKSSKRANFAPVNTYIAVPSAAHERTWLPSPDLRARSMLLLSSNASQATGSPPRRASLMSTYSASSAVTVQSRSGYGMREAQAVTTLPTSSEWKEADEGRGEASQMDFDDSAFHRHSLSSSADQPTPPLSPTSVEFYIRSARSSIDGPGSHNRLMAVTRQEEMLLSALRHKQRSMRRSALAGLQESNEGEEERSYDDARRRRSRARCSRASQTTTESTINFGSLAPPAAVKNYPRSSSERQSTSCRRRWSAAVVGGTNSPSPTVGHRSRRQSAGVEPTLEEVQFYLDTEPRLDLCDFRDWDACLSGPGGPTDARDIAGRRRSSVQPNSGSHVLLHPESFARLEGVAEERPGDAEERGVPRPDSPISPECFPAVPQKRTTRSNMARLSAVGSGLLSGDVRPR